MASKNKKKEAKTILGNDIPVPGAPLMASYSESMASTGKTRRNSSSTIERSDRFTNIEDGLVPFKHGSVNGGSNSVSIRDAVILTQKAYYNFAIFRNTIDLMAEFSASKLFLSGKNKQAKIFFESYFKKINLASFLDRFFREYFRSGNVFIYRLDTEISSKDIVKMTQTFGEMEPQPGTSLSIPIKYIILNPADIQLRGSVSSLSGRYMKVLSDYELECLKNPKTEEDKAVLNSFPPEVIQSINSKKIGEVIIPLDGYKVYAVFYKKQDYEPFAVPMGYPVLEDLNWKAEMKKMDMAVARTIQQAILLITMGAEPDKGGINNRNMEAMQALFENESIGRVLVADYTTKAQFVIPQIADILDPKKYEIVNEDIQIGLNNILIGNEKFANQSIKIQVFIERLKQAREAFLNDFLIPEIKRISQELGFKNYPTPKFEEIDLKDELEYSKMFTRLMELGILTAEEGLEAINTGRLPTPDESLESQKQFAGLKKEGLYQPIVGGPQDQLELAKQNAEMKPAALSNPGGRPSGTKKTKKTTPIGGSYSLSKLKDNMLLAQKLGDTVEKTLVKHFKLKTLNEEQKKSAESLSSIIMANESPDNWISKVPEYVKNPVDKNPDSVNEIHDIAYEHQVDSYLATLLYASKI